MTADGGVRVPGPDERRNLRRRDQEIGRYEDDSAPGVVIGAVACGTVPAPFIAVYAVLFLVHGSVHPVVPPDITRTKGGELAAGLIALGIFIVLVASLIWATTGRRRWLFVIMQAVLAGGSIGFVADSTVGGRGISVFVAVVCVAAMVLIGLPQAWPYYGMRAPVLRRRSAATPAGADPVRHSATDPGPGSSGADGVDGARRPSPRRPS